MRHAATGRYEMLHKIANSLPVAGADTRRKPAVKSA
jgi:hypothetical protein